MIQLLILIYVVFVGLGLPYSILGAAWPAMMQDNPGAAETTLGAISMVLNASTFVAMISSNRFAHHVHIKNILPASFLITGLSLLGISITRSVTWILLLSIPLGLGRGSIDASVNSFAALHYKTRYVNWLHCLWGIGSMLGPIIVSYHISRGGWADSYWVIALCQLVCAVGLLFSRSLWKKAGGTSGEKKDEAFITTGQALRRPGAVFSMAACLCYVGYEMTIGLWVTSYFIAQKGISVGTAASWASLFFAGLVISRFLSGFVVALMKPRSLIRVGCVISLCGIILMPLPFPAVFSAIGLVLIGLGCGPYYPTMISETPARFGRMYSQALVGLQMGTAYVGSMIAPYFAGWLSGVLSMAVMPVILFILCLGALAFSELAAHKAHIEY